jgi:carbon monoxide dehydrogenase subunit G
VKTTFPVSAPPEAWAALADPMRLAAALPGCRSVTRDAGGDGSLQVVTEVAVAAVRGLWAGTVAPVDHDAVRVRGSGAPGGVDVVVRVDPEHTALTVEGTVDGALGTVGSSVLAAAVRRMAEDLLAAASRRPAGMPGQDEATGVTVAVAATSLSGARWIRRAATVTGAATAAVATIRLARRRRTHRGGS